jgi:hypothetical protein
MKLMLMVVLLAAMLSSPKHGEAEPKFASRYAELSQRTDVKHPPEGEDWAYIRCHGLGSTPAWYVCTDSARCKLGFGTKPNASGIFAADSFLSWPVEWRGTLQQGRFKPFAAILRGRLANPYETKSFLTIYRLRSDGSSCIVGEASTNTTARRVADNAANEYKCEDEPELL